MKIELSCLPGWEPYLQKPALASGALPDWLKHMPTTGNSDVLAGAEVRTVKQCPPFIDAMRSGVIFPLATDVVVKSGEFSWDWDLPPHPKARMTRSPLGLHVPEQAPDVPGVDASQFAIKFNNFWTISLPQGWSMLFGHPANRLDLPFRTLVGMVDCDTWRDGYVHFPALWTDPDFEGILPAGTPIAQGWLVKRQELELSCAEMDEAALERHLQVQDGLQDEPGLYRKSYRGKSD